MNVEFNNEKVVDGINILRDAVVSTLGPVGHNVIIRKGDGSIHITKDGVTVSKYVDSDDPLEKIGIDLVRQAAEKAVLSTGDGTTTAILLASTMINEGIKLAKDTNVYKLKREMSAAAEFLVEQLKLRAKPISCVEDLVNIATISANGNKEIGKLVGELSYSLADSGIITVSESQSDVTVIETTNGYSFDKGMVSNYFSTDITKNVFDVEDCLIVLYDGKLTTGGEVINILSTTSNPILFIAHDIEAEALFTLIRTKIQAGRKVCAVRSPGFGNSKKEMMEDIAIFSNTPVIGAERGSNISTTNAVVLGKCKRVIVNRDKTVLIEGDGPKENIDLRVAQIREYLNKPDLTEFRAKDFKESIAKLLTGISTIKVGGSSEVSIRNTKDIYDDVVGACNAAKENGYVIGGGLVFYNILNSEPTYRYIREPGAAVVFNAVLSIYRTILSNAGLNEATINNICHENGGFTAYNPVTESNIDFIVEGIIDPVSVLISSINAAVGIASEFLTTNCIIK